MKPFHFTLESVSTLRRRQEQKAQERYAQALHAQRQAREALEAIQHEIHGCWQELREQLTRGCHAQKATQLQAYEKVLTQRRDESVKAVEAADRRAAAELQNMLEARQQREIVDKCFDRQKARHNREIAVDEQKMLDELAGRRSSTSTLAGQNS